MKRSSQDPANVFFFRLAFETSYHSWRKTQVLFKFLISSNNQFSYLVYSILFVGYEMINATFIARSDIFYSLLSFSFWQASSGDENWNLNVAGDIQGSWCKSFSKWIFLKVNE